MRNVVKSTILGIGLLTGVAFSAYAQTDNVAALPPGAQAPTPPAAAIAPSQGYIGPKPGELGLAGKADPDRAAVGSLCRPEARRTGSLAGKADRARGQVA